MTSAPESRVLLPHHIDHLTAEGFSDQQIDQMLCMGMHSICESVAMSRGFKVWVNDEWKSGAGIYMPFTDGFAQLRLDEPIIRSDGSSAKYLTPYKAAAEAYIPEACLALTEGWKDAIAGSLLGDVPTGAIAGVSHYKAIPEGAGYTTIFDSDGWQNPNVMGHLIRCGLYLNGKINLIPEIPGQPKAGLCEYFKAGYTAQDYRQLISKAYTPKALLFEWVKRFKSIPEKWMSLAIQKALKFTAQLLDEFEQDSLLNLLRKAVNISIHKLRSFLREVLNNLRRKKQAAVADDGGGGHKQQRRYIYEEICKAFRLKYENLINGTTFDDFVYQKFGAKKEDWCVMDSAFYMYTDNGFWGAIPDGEIYSLVCEWSDLAYKLKKTKELGWEAEFCFKTNHHSESAFKYSRKKLYLKPDANNHLRAFRNCTVDMRTGAAMPHDKEHYLTSQVPYDYHPHRSCPPVFHQFLVDAYGEDMIPIIRAFTSMFLDPTAPYGKFPHLVGLSGSGKGTLGRLWNSFYGEEGSASGVFSDIATPEGRHQYLTGKAIFGIPDIGGYVTGLRAFYELVDNGELSGRALYNPTGYQKRYYTRFWVASVDFLQIENAGDGWERRAYPISTVGKPMVPDPDLHLKLETEKADIISWALAMPRDERDRLLLSPPTNERIISLKQDAALYGDSAKSFVDLCLRPSNSERIIPNHLVHSWYVAYCQAHGYTPMGMSKFISHLKTILPLNHVPRQWGEMVSGRRRMQPAHWLNLTNLTGAFIDLAQQSNSSDNSSSGCTISEPVWKCLKSRCIEGGLTNFEDFWNQPPSPPTEPPNRPPDSPPSPNNTPPGSGGSGQLSPNPETPLIHPDPDTENQDDSIQDSSDVLSPEDETPPPMEASARDNLNSQINPPPPVKQPLSYRPCERINDLCPSWIGYAIHLPKDSNTKEDTIAEVVEVLDKQLIVHHPLLNRRVAYYPQVHFLTPAFAPNKEEILRRWAKKNNGVEKFVLGVEYPGVKARSKEIADKLRAIQSIPDWEAIKQQYGEHCATWVWRWHFTKQERQSLALIMSGQYQQQSLFDQTGETQT